MIEILNAAQLDRARVTGRLVGDILHTLKLRCRVGTNLLEMDRWARAMILDAGATSCYVDYAPSFGRGPFGHYLCTAVNDAVLHGRPRNHRLADGDLLTLDLAIVKDGIAADAAISFIVGDRRAPEDAAMIAATERALAAAIAVARPEHASVTCRTRSRRCSRAPGTRSTPSSAGTASARQCTRIHTSRTRVGLAVDSSSGPACCWRWSRGSWPIPTSWSSTPTTGGRCAAPPDAGPRTVNTRSRSPPTGRRCSPCRVGRCSEPSEQFAPGHRRMPANGCRCRPLR